MQFLVYNHIIIKQMLRRSKIMKIKKIMYFSVPRPESTICSCCGKSIHNICSVETVEGEHFNFGITCFNKLIKDKLRSFQRKEINQAMKSL